MVGDLREGESLTKIIDPEFSPGSVWATNPIGAPATFKKVREMRR
jgi:hypothetical protein